MNVQSADAAKVPETWLQKSLKKGATFLKNFVCLIAWTWLVIRLLQRPIPFEDDLSWFLLFLQNPTVRIALQIFLVAAVLAIIIFRWYKPVLKFAFFLWVRLIFFPVIALFYLFILPYKSIRFLFKGVNAFLDSFVRTSITQAAILLVLFLPASVLIVVNSEESVWLIGAVILTGLALTITLRTAFHWTSKPLIIIEEILAAYSKTCNWYLKLMIKSAQQSSKDPQKQYDSVKSQLSLVHKGLDWLHDFAERNTDQRVIVRLFFFLFAVCFLFTVVSFGILYCTLSKMHPEAFANAVGWQLLDYIYSSLLIITTSGEITPLWGVAKLAVAAEIACGVSLLTLLIFQFSMVSIPEVLAKRESVLAMLTEQRDNLNVLEDLFAKQLPSVSEKAK